MTVKTPLKYINLIKKILAPYPNTFFVFGSRAKSTHKKFSDLDLCYKKDISDLVIAEIADTFDKSDLPFKVDLVAWHRCTPQFQIQIQNDLVPVEKL
ncbi:MAG TPA: nucleotidyltransferase domain-containing protein [Coxiellaceae bacterium]|nr:nucleotidyltransferase domain-containing protein [Coxiellaceae bacterium]